MCTHCNVMLSLDPTLISYNHHSRSCVCCVWERESETLRSSGLSSLISMCMLSDFHSQSWLLKYSSRPMALCRRLNMRIILNGNTQITLNFTNTTQTQHICLEHAYCNMLYTLRLQCFICAQWWWYNKGLDRKKPNSIPVLSLVWFLSAKQLCSKDLISSCVLTVVSVQTYAGRGHRWMQGTCDWLESSTGTSGNWRWC